MGSLNYVELTNAIITIILVIASVASAYRAMQRGLTYTATTAVLIVLVLVGLSDLFSHLSETIPSLDWLGSYGLDHLVGHIGYLVFIYLEIKSSKLTVPGQPK